MRIKTKFAVLALVATFVAAAHASSVILPDACGSDKIKFDVQKVGKTGKDSTPAALPPLFPGKARVIFIESVMNTGFIFGGPNFTTRFGLDGAWVGAASSNTFFIMDIDPGVHHLCSSVQSDFKTPKDKIGMTRFNAEADKVYYVAYMLINKQTTSSGGFMGGGAGGAGNVSVSHVDQKDGLFLLDEDQGKFQVKASKLATFRIKGPDED